MNKRKKYITITLCFFVICAVVTAGTIYRKKFLENINKCSMDEIASVLQPVYASITWGKLCEDNGIEFNEQFLEEIREKYKTIIANSVLEDGPELYGYLFAACNAELVGSDLNSITTIINRYYDNESGLYSRFINSEKNNEKLLSDVQVSLEFARKKTRYNLSELKSVDEGLIKFYNDFLNKGLYETAKSEIIAIIYYFWEKNRCADIDIQRDEVKALFNELYENSMERDSDTSIWTTAEFGNLEFVDVCDAMGIDTGDLRDKTTNWNILDGDTGNWMIWGEQNLLTGVFTSGIYYYELIGGNEKYSNNIEFCDSFGSGLDKYCENILIPALDSYIIKYNMK